jgi:hypothetical protein
MWVRGDVEELEVNAAFRQIRAQATPIAEQIVLFSEANERGFAGIIVFRAE